VADRPIRVLPRLDDDNRAFWTGGENGQLLIVRCRSCGYYVHPPAPVCPRCLSRDLAPAAVSGRATIVSYTVNHQPWNPTLPTPYIIGLVELAEQTGLRLTTNIVGAEVDSVHIGLSVEVVFEHNDDVWLPFFTPVAQVTGA
jgi:uncharacterized OB-fold protein